MKPELSVIILNYNTAELLESLLPSVLASTYENLRIIVADNGSTDASVLMLKEKFSDVEVIEMFENKGFAGGYNEAISRIETDYVVLLNSDVKVEKNWLLPLIDFAISHPNVGAIQPKIKSFYDNDFFEYAGASGGFLDIFGYPFCRGRIFDEIERDNGQYDNNQEIFWASGAAFLVKQEVYQKLGGLDEKFFAHMEEIDLCWRIKNAGYKNYVVPQSVVYHIGGGTLAEGSKKKFYLNFRNSLLMLTKNLKAKDLWILFVRFFILDYLSMIKFIRDGRAYLVIQVFRAQIHFVKSFHEAWQKRSIMNTSIKGLSGIYPKSLVYQFFIKGKRKYIDLVKKKSPDFW
ncbi:MAG: glycosyltransferase family 2 protein [Bacteroidota bacterium]|nr:glycosyltransferase family 2 protein [Bacteroidota bacterium]